MKEVEVKILNIDVPAVKQQLADFGAKQTFSGIIECYFFDTEGDDLRKKNKRLRLRRRGDVVELTYKEKLRTNGIQISEELQVNVEPQASSLETVKEMLQMVGFAVYRTYSKHRESYAIGNVYFEFDTIDGVPTYLEIEGPDEPTVRQWGYKLGFGDDQMTGLPASEIIKQCS